MAKSSQSVRVRASQAAGRRRKKPRSRAERAFDEVKQVVSQIGDRLLSRSDQSKATGRIRAGQKRQAAAKKVGASRIQTGQRRQAATKKAARKRGAKTS